MREYNNRSPANNYISDNTTKGSREKTEEVETMRREKVCIEGYEYIEENRKGQIQWIWM